MAGMLVTGTFLSNAYTPLLYMGLGLCGAALLGSPFETEKAAALPSAKAGPAVGVAGTGRRRRNLGPLSSPEGGMHREPGSMLRDG